MCIGVKPSVNFVFHKKWISMIITPKKSIKKIYPFWLSHGFACLVFVLYISQNRNWPDCNKRYSNVCAYVQRQVDDARCPCFLVGRLLAFGILQHFFSKIKIVRTFYDFCKRVFWNFGYFLCCFGRRPCFLIYVLLCFFSRTFFYSFCSYLFLPSCYYNNFGETYS